MTTTTSITRVATWIPSRRRRGPCWAIFAWGVVSDFIVIGTNVMPPKWRNLWLRGRLGSLRKEKEIGQEWVVKALNKSRKSNLRPLKNKYIKSVASASFSIRTYFFYFICSFFKTTHIRLFILYYILLKYQVYIYQCKILSKWKINSISVNIYSTVANHAFLHNLHGWMFLNFEFSCIKCGIFSIIQLLMRVLLKF